LLGAGYQLSISVINGKPLPVLLFERLWGDELDVAAHHNVQFVDVIKGRYNLNLKQQQRQIGVWQAAAKGNRQQ
jgi:hypothetical protein